MASDSYWSHVAREVIDKVHQALPAGVSFAERRKAISDAYPFGERSRWPYKCWLAEQRRYLARHSDKPAGPHLVPAGGPEE